MGINDLLNSGIDILCNVEIKQWINDEEKLFYKGEFEKVSKNADYMNMRIIYMFSVDQIGLIIEVE